MPTLNKELKNKASVLRIDISYYFYSSPKASKVEIYLQKWLRTLSR